jgi:hypothetical protein
MLLSDFVIGEDFYTGSGRRWRCTDVGSRVVVAIEIDMRGHSWFVGPPYAVVERVFDENDLPGCFQNIFDAIGDRS